MVYQDWKEQVLECNRLGISCFSEAAQAVEIENITTEDKENGTHNGSINSPKRKHKDAGR